MSAHDPHWNWKEAALETAGFLLFIAAVFWILLLINGCGFIAAPNPISQAEPEPNAAAPRRAVQTSALPSVFAAISRSQPDPVTGEICITNQFSRPPGKVLCYTPSTNPPVPVTNIAALNIPWPKGNVDVWLLYTSNAALPFSNWARVLIISSNWAVNPRGVLPTPFYHFTDCTTDPARFYALLYKSQ